MERRSLLKGLVALVAAPAIIKVADLMPVKVSLQPIGWNYDTNLGLWSEVMTLDQYSERILSPMLNDLNDGFIDDLKFVDGSQWTDTEMVSLKARQALLNDSNSLLKSIDEQYHEQFGVQGAKIGDTLRIRLPSDYTVTDGPGLSLQSPTEHSFYEIYKGPRSSAVPDKLVLAAAVVAVAPTILKTPVTRRFWSRDSAV